MVWGFWMIQPQWIRGRWPVVGRLPNTVTRLFSIEWLCWLLTYLVDFPNFGHFHPLLKAICCRLHCSWLYGRFKCHFDCTIGHLHLLLCSVEFSKENWKTIYFFPILLFLPNRKFQNRWTLLHFLKSKTWMKFVEID